MTIDRASVEEGLRLATEAMAEGNYAAYASHVVNPEHYVELARDWLRLEAELADARRTLRIELEELTRLRRVEEEWKQRGEEIVSTRLAAAILIGTLASKQPGVLEWARVESVKQPPATGAMTRQLVADVQRFDEGKAGSLADELHDALANPAAEEGE